MPFHVRNLRPGGVDLVRLGVPRNVPRRLDAARPKNSARAKAAASITVPPHLGGGMAISSQSVGVGVGLGLWLGFGLSLALWSWSWLLPWLWPWD